MNCSCCLWIRRCARWLLLCNAPLGLSWHDEPLSLRSSQPLGAHPWRLLPVLWHGQQSPPARASPPCVPRVLVFVAYSRSLFHIAAKVGEHAIGSGLLEIHPGNFSPELNASITLACNSALARSNFSMSIHVRSST